MLGFRLVTTCLNMLKLMTVQDEVTLFFFFILNGMSPVVWRVTLGPEL